MGAVTPQRYHEVIEEVMAFLRGGQQVMLQTVEDAMYRAAERLDFERAGRLRDALAQARQVILSQELLTGAIERNNLVIICPSVEPGAAELFGIRHGRLFEQHTLQDVVQAGAEEEVLGLLQRLEQAAAAPLIVGQEEIDAIIIIGRWLARYGESAQVVRLPERVSQETARMILATARRIHVLASGADEGDDLWEDQPT
jgi:excinuclease UvrABC nuclease subunit